MLQRNLLYTGITRGKRFVVSWSEVARLPEQIFRIDKWSVCRGVKQLPSGEAAA